jgi:hypothetical protein
LFVSGPSPGAGTFDMGGMTGSLFGGGGMNPLAAPLNVIHNLMPNMPLSGAIQETLSKAFPQAGLNLNIAGGMQLGYQDAGMYQTIEQYSKYINQLSHSILGNTNYMGVQMSAYNNVINVWDGTVPLSTSTIEWWDLIGQPTWIEPGVVHIKVVLRGDVHAGSVVQLPPTLMTVTPGALAPGLPDQKKNLSFAGNFTVTKLYHVGDFRNPDGANWSTMIEAFNKDAIMPSSANVFQPASIVYGSPGDQQQPENTGPPAAATPQMARVRLRSLHGS